MARRKQLSPMPRIDSGEVMQTLPDQPQARAAYVNGIDKNNGIRATPPQKSESPQARSGVLSLVVCVGGIYASFLTWGLLQERITTTPYHPVTSTLRPQGNEAQEFFRYPIFVNTIQALFAFISGSLYLLSTTGKYQPIPTRSSILPLFLISVTTTLASPFGYASLAHVDYLTFVLAKSCKLLPVMFLHVTLFGKRYPLSKYLIVLTVTAGVAIFTIFHPPKPGRKSKAVSTSSAYGLALLGVNLLFDGLTNTLQDHIFQNPLRYGSFQGAQMMVGANLTSTVLMAAYLLVTPLIPASSLPSMVPRSVTTELSSALAFLARHPRVLNDVLGFAACGAVGQLFIFATLQRFGSLLLVTVTVTRKMLTMVLSVVWYGHRLTPYQWGGVALVFAGIGGEALIERKKKMGKVKMG